MVLSLDRRSLCLQVTEHFSLACLGTNTKFTSAFKILYQKFALAALWHGPNKPNFKVLMTKIVFEIKTVLKRTFDFEEIGIIRFVARSIVCDIPATAYCISMYQHMGYFNCTFCLMKGFRHNNQMIFPVMVPICLRTEESSSWCAQQSVRRSRPVLGIKDISRFNEVFSFPKDAPIDAMHQVFLGTGKVLTKMIISVLKKLSTHLS